MNDIKLRIIALFSKDLNRELTINQIKNKLKRSYHLIYDNTTELIKQKILNKKTRGHSTVCSLNLKNEKTKAMLILNAINEKEKFLNKKIALKPLFEELVNNITNKIEVLSIILFGSYAKGRETKSSDIDLLIICDKKDKNNIIQREIGALETMYDHEINQIVVNKKMFKNMIINRAELNVGKEALNNHTILYGAELFWKIVLDAKNDYKS